jgi:hypothetical protein
MNTLDRIALLECEICQKAAAKGVWPEVKGQRITHCKDCHRSWTSIVQAHCTVCHENFATNGTADLHWRETKGGEPEHLDWAKVKVTSGQYKGKPVFFSADEAMGSVVHRLDHRDKMPA